MQREQVRERTIFWEQCSGVSQSFHQVVCRVEFLISEGCHELDIEPKREDKKYAMSQYVRGTKSDATPNL